MKNYYVVYDQTPYDERKENYNQIGIGLQNDNAEMLERHYDYSASNAGNFHPTKAAEDSSHALPGYPSVYIVDIIPAVLPTPAPIVDPTHNKTVTPVKNTTTPIEPIVVPTNTTKNTTVPTNTTVPVVPVVVPTNTTVPTNKTSNTTVPIKPVVKPTHDPSKFIPNDHAGPQNNAAEAGVPANVNKAPVKKSDHTLVYLISGIGALIFVILVGLCLCKRNGAASHSHRQIDQKAAGENAPLKENAYNLNGGSMNV